MAQDTTITLGHGLATRDAIRQSLTAALPRFLPEADYRNFYGWALSSANPDREAFTRSIAVDQLAALTDDLLGDLCEPRDWPELLRYAIPAILYQVFEVVSDNLALGMFGPSDDGHAPLRRELLLDFDAAAIAQLRLPTNAPASRLLSGLRPDALTVSAFTQSLAVRLHARVARNYVDSVGGASIERLEYSVWDGLVANLEAGRAVLDIVGGTQSEPMIRQGTIDRYAGSSRVLQAWQVPRLERAMVGAQTIMVVPTLSYFTAGLAEVVDKNPAYRRVVVDGSLLEVLSDAALLVRLQNDIGTRLLTMPSQERLTLLAGISGRFPPETRVEADTALTLMQRASSHEPAFNRFHKDLTNGEYNVCLCELANTDDPEAGLAALADSLAYYSSLYLRHKTALGAGLRALLHRIRDRRVCELISRFVSFHERMYTRRYDAGAGDYAV